MRYTADMSGREAGHAVRARALRLLLASAAAAGLAACSFAIPSLVPDGDESTGSIGAAATVGRELGLEDARRARSALALALDPQGSGTAVNWDNPDTKVRGTITPVGQPYVRESEICRDFKALVSRTGRATTRDGTACRVSPDEWAIQYVGFRRRAS